MITLIDNYDSFTYNIYHSVCKNNKKVQILKNDELLSNYHKIINSEAVIISPGPSNPFNAGECLDLIGKIHSFMPIFGICLGHQILALTLGAKTKKMKLGHRGANHPVKNLLKGNVEITSQNHGFEIVRESLPKNIEITHTSLFDNCIEGIRLKNKPVFSVQYHPESNPGPQDSVYLFQEFVNEMKKNAKKKRS